MNPMLAMMILHAGMGGLQGAKAQSGSGGNPFSGFLNGAVQGALGSTPSSGGGFGDLLKGQMPAPSGTGNFQLPKMNFNSNLSSFL